MPKSSMNLVNLAKSSSLTVFLELANERNMSDIETFGSSSLSLGTSIIDILMAPASQGAQGVSRSLTISSGSVLDGPRT